jgi:hypothetical protein
MAGTRELCKAATILWLFLTAANQASAGFITSFRSSAPSETHLSLDRLHSNVLDYTAIFTNDRPITFTIGVSSPGRYYLAAPNDTRTNNVKNATGRRWTAFDVEIGQGDYLSSFGFSKLSTWSHSSFRGPPPHTDLHLFGGTGLASGGSVYVSPGVTVTGRAHSPATFEVTLEPTAVTPEPSTLVLASTAMMLIGASRWWQRRRRT